MKTLLLVFSCLLFFCSAAAAQLNGSDDFNDNNRDTNKWLIVSNQLSEANGRLEFSSSGSGEEEGIWAWILNSGSYTQNWSATIDACILLNSAGMNNQYGQIVLAAVNSNDDERDIFTVGIAVGDDIGVDGGTDRVVVGFCQVDGADVFDTGEIVATNLLTLRVSFDAATKTLCSAYDKGTGFTTLTNFNISAWGMNNDDTFIVAIAGFSTNLAVTSGQVYADNFEAITDPGISNHVSFVSIGHTRNYYYTTADDEYEYAFSVEVETDDSVTNITFTTPADETIVAPYDGFFTTKSSTPLTNRFEDGDYTVEVTYTNGVSESTVIPFAQADGVSPLTNVTTRPLITAPDPLHNTLFSPTSPLTSSAYITLEWGGIDAHAKMINFWRHHYMEDDWEELGIFSDIVPFADGPLSTRSLGPLSFTQGVWEVEFLFDNLTCHTNSDGVIYAALKGAESHYIVTVLEASEDEDDDEIPNWWESLYFGGPTNCLASDNPDEDGCDNLEEYISGMNPTNPASCFMITNCSLQAGPPAGFLIEWPSVSGRVYRAHWAPTLTNSFQPLETNIFYPRNSCTDTVHGADGKCFYRIDVQLNE